MLHLRRFGSPTKLLTSNSVIPSQQILSHFQHTEEMVDYLTSITTSELMRIRHISVRGTPFPLYPPDDNSCYKTYGFPSVLALFPGLKLDTLTVYDAYHGEGVDENGWGHNATYSEAEDLLSKAKGFKELIFISVNNKFLNSNYLGREKLPQPSTWDRMIKERDSVDSGAGVEMFTVMEGQRRRMVGDHPFSHIRRDGSVTSAYQNQDDERDPGYESWAVESRDAVPLSEGVDHRDEIEKSRDGIEVRVRRGNGADYMQDGKSLSEFDDELYSIFAKLSWKEIKEQELFVFGAEDCPTGHL